MTIFQQKMYAFWAATSVVMCVGFMLVIPARAHAESIPADTVHFSFTETQQSIQTASSTAHTANTLTIPTGQQSFSYTSPHTSPEFAFNSFGVTWHGDLPADDTIQLTAHFSTPNGEQTHHLPVLDTGDLKQSLPEHFFSTDPISAPLNTTAFWIEINLLRATSGASPQVTDLDIHYYNTATPSNASLNLQNSTVNTVSNSSSLSHVSREEWGADESLGTRSDGSPVWPQEYADVQAIVIHHTAGSDGGDDPAATVRSIYYWHTVVLGWGDIGYNYLIDPAGTIYKGRAGTLGVIGGHTYNSSTNTNFNVGTTGIALLGCYEASSGCSTQYEMTPEMRNALTTLVAKISAKRQFGPKSSTTLHGVNTLRVVGHRDLDYTSCPGNMVHDDFVEIREEAKIKYKKLTQPQTKGRLTAFTINSAATGIHVQEGPLTATVTYKNTGSTTWKKKSALLMVYNKTGKKRSSLRARTWPDRFGRLTMTENSVAPGQEAHFTFRVRAPKKTVTKTIITDLVVKNKSAKKAQHTQQIDFVAPLNADFISTSLPIAVFQQAQYTASITYTNNGYQAWEQPITLLLNDIVVSTVSQHIEPGQSMTMQFTYTTPRKTQEGQTEHLIFKLRSGETIIPGSRYTQLIGIH